MNTENKNGWDYDVHLGPVIDTIGKVAEFIGGLVKHIVYAPDCQSNHYVPFSEEQPWKSPEH